MSSGAKKALADPLLKKYSLAGFELECGVTLPKNAELGYRIFGDGPKLCVCGTSYSATHLSLEYHYGTTIDKSFTFVVFNMLGNGVSFSPSNGDYTATPTLRDNVRASRLALDADPELKGRKIDLAFGFSMGAMTALEWGRAFDDVSNVAAVCGTSGCNAYNQAFLDALILTLSSPMPQYEKLRNFGSIFCAWFVGPDFYKNEVWRDRGYTSIGEFMEKFGWTAFDEGFPDDLLAMLRTWQATRPFTVAECQSIKARVLLLPCDNDTYFRVADIKDLELPNIPNVSMKVIQSPWGHLAGNPTKLPTEHSFISSQIRAFLDEAES